MCRSRMPIVFLAFAVLLCALLVDGQAACGKRPSFSSSRIVGGSTAKPNSWPWQLSLSKNGRHICGASLIDRQWAVTAVHCVKDNAHTKYTVMTGGHHRTNNDGRGNILRISKIVSHEKYYQTGPPVNDVALLKLAHPVNLSSTINTICLPKQGSRPQGLSNCWTTGWGRYLVGSSALPTYLQEAKVPIVYQCSRLKNYVNRVQENTMICAGGTKSTACNGDSGGPLVCKENGNWVLRGVASWVIKTRGQISCSTTRPAVFARASTFVSWINSAMNGGAPPVDGGLGPWTDWTKCSKACGQGTQSRRRLCNNPPPAYGGKNCPSASQQRSCKIKNCGGGGCFSLQSKVQTINRGALQISDVRIGDKLLSVKPRGELVYSRVVAFLDYEERKTSAFVRLETADGHVITLTDGHLIYRVPQENVTQLPSQPVFASDVTEADYIFVALPNEQQRVYPSRVVKIARVQEKGFIAPLTDEGTVVVSGIAASCYAVVDDHWFAHKVFAPLRYLYQATPAVFNFQGKPDGISWYPKLLLQVNQFMSSFHANVI